MRSEANDRPSMTAALLEALRLHARVAPRLFAAWSATCAAVIVLPLLSTILMGRVVGAIPQGHDAVIRALVALAIVDLVDVPLESFRWTMVTIMGYRYRAVHRERLMRTVLDPPGIGHVYDPAVLDAAQAADNAWVVNMLEGVMSVGVKRVIGAGALVIVGVHQPIAAAVLGGAWLIVGRWGWSRTTAVHEVVTGQSTALRRAHAIGELATTPPAAKEVRVFGLGAWLRDKYLAEWWTAMSQVFTARRQATRGAARMCALLLLAHSVALLLIARDAAAGRIGLGALVTILAAVHQSRELGEGVWGHYEIEFGIPVVAAASRLERAVAERSETRYAGGTVLASPRDAIRFEAVSFRYPGAERDVLHDLDLEIPVGLSLALVGENGAGKTTLIQLLTRLRDPTRGDLSVDGTSLTSIDPRAWQQMVAAVSQQPLRLPLSARDNVGAGLTDDVDVLDRAAATAGASEIVKRMPARWDTPLSREMRNGADLSGGEWQRLALARAFAALECGAEVLVLDEPTAHLDVRAEADVYDRFLELTRGRTTILVSHRFSTVRRADCIAVLSGGRIAETGTHDELVGVGGIYAELFAYQASRYQDQPLPLGDQP